MSHPLVSIIVPCYNQEEFLAEALDSVLEQTYENWECVIVDDASTDGSLAVAKRYAERDARFIYIEHQCNHGLSITRNTGIKASRGKYILPLDADDKIADRYLEKAVEYFSRFPDTKVVYSKARLFGAVNKEWILPDYSFDTLIWTNCLFCSSIFSRKDYEETIGYNPNMRYGFEDWDFWLSLLTPGSKVHRIDEILFYYRKKDYSMSNDTYNHRKEAFAQIHDNHPELYAPFYRHIIEIKRAEVIQREFYLNILHSKSYKLGHMILRPINKLYSLFK